MVNELYFVTGNKKKADEFKRLFQMNLKFVKLELPEIQSMDMDEVLKDKAINAFSHLKKPIMVDDCSYEIQSWNGFPGPFVKYLLHCLGPTGICKALNSKNRDVLIKNGVCIYNGKKMHIFTGEIRGEISKNPRGTHGLGYDSISIPKGQNRTYGEMNPTEKKKYDARVIALEKLLKFLKSNPKWLK